MLPSIPGSPRGRRRRPPSNAWYTPRCRARPRCEESTGPPRGMSGMIGDTEGRTGDVTVALPERAERAPRPGARRHDVVVVGGGHNGLVAAAFLARAGMAVTLLERLDHVGGAAVSASPFAGLDARLSRYSYLVSLLPYTIVRNLELVVELRSRPVSSYTPLRARRPATPACWSSAAPAGPRRSPSGGSPAATTSTAPGAASTTSWTGWPAPSRRPCSTRCWAAARWRRWSARRARPRRGNGSSSSRSARPWTGSSRTTRCAAWCSTDALIGTDSYAEDPSLKQNRCFLYHIVGNGHGEWRVPVGGMGSVSDALHRAALDAGVRIVTGAEVVHIDPGANPRQVRRQGRGHLPRPRGPRARPVGRPRPGRRRPDGARAAARRLGGGSRSRRARS